MLAKDFSQRIRYESPHLHEIFDGNCFVKFVLCSKLRSAMIRDLFFLLIHAASSQMRYKQRHGGERYTRSLRNQTILFIENRKFFLSTSDIYCNLIYFFTKATQFNGQQFIFIKERLLRQNIFFT